MPLSLPPDFNPATFMLAKATEYGTFHESRRAARLAGQLLASGAAEDVALAHDVLAAVLACQETDPRDPHVGNFYWMREDDQVEDLNAVEFVLEALIPLMQRHGHLLDTTLRDRVLAAIRLGLDEIRRLDVLVAYTNITALDVLNTCLGGELLGDPAIAQRGYAKLAAWLAFTARSGHPLEYNSPTYTAVTLRALKELRDQVQDATTRHRAGVFAARLALSVALHNHVGTGRWAGPHSRAYQPSIVGETPPEIEQLRGWIADGIVPAWIEEFLAYRAREFTVIETAEQSLGLAFSTYQTPAFALGVASRNFNDQNNVCLAHYTRPHVNQTASDRPGVFYTRYLFDDKWFGDIYHRTDRTKTRNLPDEGTFCGVQSGPVALGVYLPTRMSGCESAKAALIWTGIDQIDAILVDGQAVELPHQLKPSQMVVVTSGDVYLAVRPLTVTRLCKQPPMQLAERGGDLVLELYNYQGVYKRFWEMGWPGAFFQGYPVCAFAVELAPRTAYADGAAFGQALADATVEEVSDAPFTYAGEGERRYRVSYTRDGHTAGLDIDLMSGAPRRRWTETGDVGWPMLDAPWARESHEGRVEIGATRLECTPGPAWLAALPDGGWVIGYAGQEPASVIVTTPERRLGVADMGPGVIVWRNGEVEIDGSHGEVHVE